MWTYVLEYYNVIQTNQIEYNLAKIDLNSFVGTSPRKELRRELWTTHYAILNYCFSFHIYIFDAISLILACHNMALRTYLLSDHSESLSIVAVLLLTFVHVDNSHNIIWNKNQILFIDVEFSWRTVHIISAPFLNKSPNPLRMRCEKLFAIIYLAHRILLSYSIRSVPSKTRRVEEKQWNNKRHS